jgi:FkbM family methyltransferase
MKTWASSIKSFFDHIIKTFSPALYWKLKLRNLRHSTGEYELRIAPLLCHPQKGSIDIGADGGVYSVNLCDRSAYVIAFEPRPARAARIRDMAASAGLPIDVQQVALSDQDGLARLRVLTNDAGRSTIEAANTLEDPDGSPQYEIRVPKLRLDDYELRDVGFVKIDVEGHELAVLQGAVETIRASRPALLVEIEDRHRANAVADVLAFMGQLGYEGFFVLDGELKSCTQFDRAMHQDPANIGGWKDRWVRRGTYINNFFLVPAGCSSALKEAVAAARSSRQRLPRRLAMPHPTGRRYA